jgi:hypothetical protein
MHSSMFSSTNNINRELRGEYMGKSVMRDMELGRKSSCASYQGAHLCCCLVCSNLRSGQRLYLLLPALPPGRLQLPCSYTQA